MFAEKLSEKYLKKKTADALQEILMDSDSQDESSASLHDFDDSNNDPDYAETRSKNGSSDDERDLDLLAPNSRPPKRPRSTHNVDLDPVLG